MEDVTAINIPPPPPPWIFDGKAADYPTFHRVTVREWFKEHTQRKNCVCFLQSFDRRVSLDALLTSDCSCVVHLVYYIQREDSSSNVHVVFSWLVGVERR